MMLISSSFACLGYNSYILSKASSTQIADSNAGTPPAINSNITSSTPAPNSNATPPAPPSNNAPLPTVAATNAPITQGNPPPTGQMTAIKATFYTDVGTMADGHPTHFGACAAYIPQFPFGTMLKLYHPNDLNQPAYTCTVEDSGTHICQGNIDVWIASVPEALQLGVEDMQAQVVGFNKAIAQDAANNHPASPGCELGKTH